MNWTEKLPWWVKWAFAGGTGIVSAFAATEVGPLWQARLFFAGGAVTFFAIAGAAWHLWRNRLKQAPIAPIPEWSSVPDAIKLFCDPAIVKRWRDYTNTRQDAMERGWEIEREMREIAREGWKDRPEALDKYNALRERMERFSSVASAAGTGLTDTWGVLRDELVSRLVSGELITQGFVEPYTGGQGEVRIKPAEWRILILNMGQSLAVRRNDESNIIYTGVEIARAFPSSAQHPSRRMSVLDLMAAAEADGWVFAGGRAALYGFHKALQEAGLNSEIVVSGRRLKAGWDLVSAVRIYPLEAIECAYFREHWIDVHQAWMHKQNAFMRTSRPAQMEKEFYSDLHVERVGALTWLHGEARHIRDRVEREGGCVG